MSESAEDSLQEASAALRRAVEVSRRRPADDVAAKALVAEFHELRTLMSTATLLMSSFGLPRFAGVIQSRTDANPGDVLDQADGELAAASDHLSQAAARLTAARQHLDSLT